MNCITILDKIREALKAHFATTAQAAIADSASDPAASSAPPSGDKLAGLSAILARKKKAADEKRKKKRHGGGTREPKVRKHEAVKLKLPSKPSCIAPGCTDYVHVIAMLRGPAGRDLWVDMDSFEWLIAFACDEFRCLGITRPYVAPNHTKADKKPNFKAVPGLWKGYCHHYHRFHFEFPAAVDGLPEREIGKRRYLPVAAINDTLWDAFGEAFTQLDEATFGQRRDAGPRIIEAWCGSILGNCESAFLSAYRLPDWYNTTPTAAVCDVNPHPDLQKAFAAFELKHGGDGDDGCGPQPVLADVSAAVDPPCSATAPAAPIKASDTASTDSDSSEDDDSDE